MPSPVECSLTVIIGLNPVSAFDFDIARQIARRPSTELAPPISTPNSVRATGVATTSAAAGTGFVVAAGMAPVVSGAVGAGSVDGAGPLSSAVIVCGDAIIDFQAISGAEIGLVGAGATSAAGVVTGGLAGVVSVDGVWEAAGLTGDVEEIAGSSVVAGAVVLGTGSAATGATGMGVAATTAG